MSGPTFEPIDERYSKSDMWPEEKTPSARITELSSSNSSKLSEAQAKSELDRLASFLTYQEELIAELSMRLRTVSHATPKEQELTVAPEEFHLSAFIDRIRVNNEKLKTIHHELAI